MKKFIIKKEITTVIFMIILFVFSAVNFYHTLPFLKQIDVSGVDNLDDVKTVVSDTELTISDNVYGKYTFVEGYGLWNLILNKEEIDGFSHVKDKNGYLHYSDFWNNSNNEIDEIVNTVVNLRNKAAEYGTEVIVVMPPVKDDTSVVDYEKGMPYCDKDWVADEYLDRLGAEGINTMDFRDTLADSDLKYEDIFYVTDHHWTTKAVFYCFQKFVAQMNEWYNLDLDSEGIYTNEDNYNVLLYKDSNLGSHGRDVGMVYAGGLDDFTLMYPKYYTSFNYKWYVLSTENVLDGRFEDTVVSTYNIINSNIYKQDKYSSYLNGVASYDKIKNNINKDAPKVLFLRDSCSSPFGAFVSQVFSQTDLMWTLNLDNDLDKYFDIADYDYVIVSLYPDSLKESMFKFNYVKE